MGVRLSSFAGVPRWATDWVLDVGAAILGAAVAAIAVDRLYLPLYLVWPAVSASVGEAHRDRPRPLQRVWRTGTLVSAGLAFALAVGIAERGTVLSVITVQLPIVAVAALVLRLGWAEGMRRWRAPLQVVIAGESLALFELLNDLKHASALSVVGVAVPRHEVDSCDESLPGLVSFDIRQLPEFVTTHQIDLVLTTWSASRAQRLAWTLEGTRARVASAALWDLDPRRLSVAVHGRRTLAIVEPTRIGSDPLARRIAERGAALVALALLAPVFALIAAAIRLGDGGPVFFQQMRTGAGGSRFCMFKFRSMCPEAESLKLSLMSANHYSAGTLFKVPSDPRTSRVGGWLRKTSLDELPQLINVLKGDMRFVGPRPTSVTAASMQQDYRRRLLVRPGITGLWQVSGRSDLPWEEAERLDLFYVENRSFIGDLTILGRTVPAVLSRRGAY